jgi:hypothetical protein
MGTDWASSTNCKAGTWGGISIGEKLLVDELWPYIVIMLYTLFLPELF